MYIGAGPHFQLLDVLPAEPSLAGQTGLADMHQMQKRAAVK